MFMLESSESPICLELKVSNICKHSKIKVIILPFSKLKSTYLLQSAL